MKSVNTYVFLHTVAEGVVVGVATARSAMRERKCERIKSVNTYVFLTAW